MAKLQKLKSMVVKNEDDGAEEKWLKHYSSSHRILLVGDSDFSFSLCFATAFGSGSNIVATSLDSHDEVSKKYRDGKSNIKKLKKLGAHILHGVDAMKMMRHKDLKSRKFDKIVFNFPHAGFHGREDHMNLIRMHQSLLNGFFKNASSMLRSNGEVHVNHKSTRPYSCWNLEELASRNSLSLTECTDFKLNDYPGYHNKRGGHPRCDEPFPLGKSSTYKFIPSRTAKKRFVPQVHQDQNRASSRHTEPSSWRHYNYPRLSITKFIDGADLQKVESPCTITGSNCARIFDGYFEHVLVTYGRPDHNVAFKLHEELRPGYNTCMSESPRRTVNVYILLCELQHLSISRSAWLREILGISTPPHF